MNSYRFTISLRLRHPSIDPNRITEALGRKPTHAWQAGAPRRTPKGTPLPGTYRESYWTSGRLREGTWSSSPRSPEGLAWAIEELLSELTEHRRFFQEIRASGGSVEFFIGWFLDGNTGDVFGHDLLRKLADLQIDLSLDLYPPGRAAPEPPLPPGQGNANLG